MYASIIIIIGVIVLFILLWSNLRDNGTGVDELRDNNSESERINRETADIIGKLETENREARELNGSIREDNKKAGDIIKGVRKRGAISKDS